MFFVTTKVLYSLLYNIDPTKGIQEIEIKKLKDPYSKWKILTIADFI